MTVDDNMPPSLFMKPGEIVVSDEPLTVTTLLGSCVAVTMFVQRLRVGAICHALLPSHKTALQCCRLEREAGKYVQCAIRIMLERPAERCIAKGEIETKLFGGSDMFDMSEGRSRSVGRQNAETALSMLEGESLRPVTQDLGGRRGRKIIFHTHTGEVFLKRLRKSEI